jgi:hypothetical protein
LAINDTDYRLAPRCTTNKKFPVLFYPNPSDKVVSQDLN